MPTPALKLPHLATVLVSGADARTFLQGQVSADLDQLTADTVLLASCNSPQGRVEGVLWILQRVEAIALVVPASMLDSITARLRKYTLRAKVELRAGSELLRVYGATMSDPPDLARERAHVQHGTMSYIRWPGVPSRLLILAPSTEAMSDEAQIEAWRLADIRAGLPQVYPQTHERFVAQMLNLDLLAGISFEKGCYTGQEIIARTHYRGAIKRRMFRFQADCDPPAPGTRLLHAKQHAGDVVDSAPTEKGCELLAVVNLVQKDERLSLDGTEQGELHRVEMPYGVEGIGIRD